MTTLREAAQQTLEALKIMQPEVQMGEGDAAIKALKAALAEPVQEPDPGEYHGWVLREVLFDNGEPVGHREPVQEPVAWSYELATTMLEHGYDGWEHLITRYKPNVPEGSIRNLTPLYTAPPQRKPLTDDQLDDIAVAARRGNLYDLRIAIDRAHETGDNDD